MNTALTELQLLLADMQKRTTALASEALVRDLGKAVQLATTAALEAEPSTQDQATILHLLKPKTQVRDAEGDLWRKTKKGNWRLQMHDGRVLHTAESVVYTWGPVRILTEDNT